MVQLCANTEKASMLKDCFHFALFNREEGTIKETISQHKQVCTLSYSWKIAHSNNADFVFSTELPDLFK